MRSFLAECLLASALKAQPYFFLDHHHSLKRLLVQVSGFQATAVRLCNWEGWVWQETGVALNDIQFEVGFFGDLECYVSEPYE